MRKQTLKSLKNNQETAINFNTDQLFAGELADGSKMPDYSITSVTVFNKPPGPWRLYETGAFYRGIFMQTDKFPVVFSSKDSKTGKIADMLAAKGGNPDEIFGLNKQNLKDIAKEYVLPDLQSFIRSLIRVR